MSRSSIFETAWIDLVFEGRNKDYGAYQLRQENPRTTFKALFVAMLLLTVFATLSLTLSSSGSKTLPPVEDWLGPTVFMDDIVPPEPPKPPTKSTVVPPAKIEDPKPAFKDPEVVKQSQADPETPTNADFPATTSSPAGAAGGTGTDPTPSNGGGTSTEPTESVESPTKTYGTASLDKMPAFPGGIDRFYTYVGRNFRTPEAASDSGNTIRVMVAFVIEKDGTMTDIRVVRDPGYGLDKEAIRVLKSMKTKWDPGIINGKPVRVAYTLPIAVKAP